MALNYQKSFAPAPQAPALSPTTQAPTPPPLKFMQDSTPAQKPQDVMLSGASGNDASREKELKLTLSRLNDLVSSGVTPDKVEEYRVLSTHAGSLVSSLPPETAKNVISSYPSDIQKAVNFGTDKSVMTSSNNPATNASMYAAIQQKEQEIRFQKQESDFNRAFKEGNFAALEGKGPDSWNKLLHNDSINDAKGLNYAISKGWDINAAHKNTDGTTSTYVEKQQTDFTKTIKNTQAVETQADKAHQMMKEAEAKGDKKKVEELRKYQEQLAAVQNKENQKQINTLNNTKNAIETGKLNSTELSKAEETAKKAQEEAERLDKRAEKLNAQGRTAEAQETKKQSTNLSKASQTIQGTIDNVKHIQNQDGRLVEKSNTPPPTAQPVTTAPKIPQLNSQAQRETVQVKETPKSSSQSISSTVAAPRIPTESRDAQEQQAIDTSKTIFEKRNIKLGLNETTTNSPEHPTAPRRPNLLAALGSNAAKVADTNSEPTMSNPIDKGRAA